MPERPVARRIAANVRALRLDQGWSQFDAVRHLAASGGPVWSNVAWSSMETSATAETVHRSFTADDVAALAALFGVPVCALFGDPCGCADHQTSS